MLSLVSNLLYICNHIMVVALCVYSFVVELVSIYFTYVHTVGALLSSLVSNVIALWWIVHTLKKKSTSGSVQCFYVLL